MLASPSVEPNGHAQPRRGGGGVEWGGDACIAPVGGQHKPQVRLHLGRGNVKHPLLGMIGQL